MLIDGYVRVSTLEQAREGYSIGAQTERLKAYCAARGWTLRSIHTDPGHSGAKLDRPGLQTLISDVRAGRCNGVLVYKLDRLSRSQKDTLYLIEDIFLANGVSFISINENFDTSTAFGRAMIGILSVFAQLEREQIRERTMMGAAERATSGLWHGGGWEPIGYDYIPERDELQVNEYEAMQVREVYDCYLNRRMSLYKITQHMTEQGYRHKTGGWDHASTVRNVLKNNLYAGIISWGGHDYPGQHMPLIDREVFDKVQNKLELQGTQAAGAGRLLFYRDRPALRHPVLRALRRPLLRLRSVPGVEKAAKQPAPVYPGLCLLLPHQNQKEHDQGSHLQK